MRFIRRYVPNSSLVLATLDVLCIVSLQSFTLSFIWKRLELASPMQAFLVSGISILVNLIFLYASGCFRRDATLTSGKATSRMPVALGFSAFSLIVLLHYGMGAIYPDDDAYRSLGQTLTIVLVLTAISLASSLFSRIIFRFLARRHWFRRKIAVIGAGQRALYLAKLLAHGEHEPVLALSFLSEDLLNPTAGDHQRVCVPELADSVVASGGRSLQEIISDIGVDEVVLAADERRGLMIEKLLSCKTKGVPVTEYTSFIERETARVDLRWVEQSWLVYSDGFQMGGLDRGLKRLLDIVVSVAGLVVAMPVVLIGILFIMSEGPGPIFYRQQRVTRDGRVFWLVKLRTMRPDAEKKGPQWADANDTRITRVGAFLRRSRIDEIPQLLNILFGDMSLVGPRPERPVFTEQLAQHIQFYDLRHTVKAGLTGWAQVNYPYGASIDDAKAKLEYDLYYIKNYTFLRDVLIILQTLRVVLWPQGVR